MGELPVDDIFDEGVFRFVLDKKSGKFHEVKT